MSYTTDTIRKIYDDASGDWISVSPDCDGLSLVEIASSGATEGVISLPPGMALVVADAIRALAMEMISAAEQGQ